MSVISLLVYCVNGLDKEMIFRTLSEYFLLDPLFPTGMGVGKLEIYIIHFLISFFLIIVFVVFL